jgi:hypothetical protein
VELFQANKTDASDAHTMDEFWSKGGGQEPLEHSGINTVIHEESPINGAFENRNIHGIPPGPNPYVRKYWGSRPGALAPPGFVAIEPATQLDGNAQAHLNGWKQACQGLVPLSGHFQGDSKGNNNEDKKEIPYPQANPGQTPFHGWTNKDKREIPYPQANPGQTPFHGWTGQAIGGEL